MIFTTIYLNTQDYCQKHNNYQQLHQIAAKRNYNKLKNLSKDSIQFSAHTKLNDNECFERAVNNYTDYLINNGIDKKVIKGFKELVFGLNLFLEKDYRVYSLKDVKEFLKDINCILQKPYVQAFLKSKLFKDSEFLPVPFKEYFNQYSSLINKDYPIMQLLLDYYTNNCRQNILMTLNFKPLVNFKAGQITPESKDAYENYSHIIKHLKTKTRYIGLSEEVKKIVQQTEKDLNVKINIGNNKDLANYLDDVLHFYHQFYPLAAIYDFMNIERFNGENNYKTEAFCAYFKKGGSAIFFNPFFLRMFQHTNNWERIDSVLRHEHGHHWHRENIKTVPKMGFEIILDDEEKVLYEEFVRFLSKAEKKPVQEYMNLTVILTYLKDFQNLKDYKSCFSDNKKQLFSSITIKLEYLNNLLKEITDNTFHGKYLLTKPAETVAVATQYEREKPFSKQLRLTLKQLGKMDFKEFSYLPDDHPVIKNQKQTPVE